MNALLILSAVFTFVLFGCMPSASLLTNVSPKMSKQEVKRELGQPESVSSSFITDDGRAVEIWDYKLYQYKGATGLSPYFDIYGMVFVDGKLVSWKKTEKGARLSEDAALRLIGVPKTKVEVEIK
jgi:hypothetical protein